MTTPSAPAQPPTRDAGDAAPHVADQLADLPGYLKDHPAAYSRMIAAYVIGYSVTKDYFNIRANAAARAAAWMSAH